MAANWQNNYRNLELAIWNQEEFLEGKIIKSEIVKSEI
jgi:hypothetical protein